MAAAACDRDPFDGMLADKAPFSLSPIDPVLKLKESGFALGVHIVRNRRAAGSNRFIQHRPKRKEQLAQFCLAERCGPATWAHAGAKQRLVRIDVPHAAQQSLVQQGALDRSLAAPKNVDKLL